MGGDVGCTSLHYAPYRVLLMPNANGNTVHLMYLPLLSNLHNNRSYNWGSAMLAMLYRELCQTTDPSTMDIGRCFILLQSWALYRMSFLTSICHQPYKLWRLFPRLPMSTQSYGALAHLLSIFRQWSGIMAIEYSDNSVAYSISRHGQYDWGRSMGLTGRGGMEMIREKCMKNILRCGIIG
ncbi:hypothetical protein PVK06_040464 [Gossypium arboreum]|uniref:Aminotransferase-like plant mobile domain-containing protein n=1 Tax=Gossypium arboreum TaxID=29729 RepID=A0ABR0N5G7_GOSAR|nr:hypothetical protein PVK06_040464 [Gossypium arboreum]